jgi:hypothetical protein
LQHCFVGQPTAADRRMVEILSNSRKFLTTA